MASLSDRFQPIECPPSVRQIEPSNFRGSHIVDYAAHPAYAGFVSSVGIGDRVRAGAAFAKAFLPLLLKRVIRYEMIPYDTRQQGGLAFARAAFRNMLRLDQRVSPETVDSDLFRQLNTNGVGVVAIPAARFERLEKIAQHHFDGLLSRRGAPGNKSRAFDDSRSNASRVSDSALYLDIEQLFEESGVMEAASAYLGRRAKLADVNPQINDRSDSFWRDIFPDMQAGKIPSAAYYHRDASGGDLKAIVYMSDVLTEAHGAFSYVLGSNHVAAQGLDDLISEANDHGLSATDPETRKLFAALPQKLRQKGSFGNDVSDDSEQAQLISECSWAITSTKGAIVLFDTKGIHRGGMVEAGERRVITCVLG